MKLLLIYNDWLILAATVADHFMTVKEMFEKCNVQMTAHNINKWGWDDLKVVLNTI